MTAPGRRETREERADRRWAELLQEVRVAQTGAQILLGFLLSVAFTPRFSALDGFERALYVVTVVLGSSAIAALISPVAFHRMLFGRHLKPELVAAVSRLLSLGVLLLGLTVGTVLLLLLRVSTNPALAWALTGVVMLWFAVCWLLLPRRVLRRGARAVPPLSGSEDPRDGGTRRIPLNGSEDEDG
jgi:hypothetical protein